jgi:hypothetical protein
MTSSPIRVAITRVRFYVGWNRGEFSWKHWIHVELFSRHRKHEEPKVNKVIENRHILRFHMGAIQRFKFSHRNTNIVYICHFHKVFLFLHENMIFPLKYESLIIFHGYLASRSISCF